MSIQQSTPAMRAAEAIRDYLSPDSADTVVEKIATIIDRETKCTQLTEALKTATDEVLWRPQIDELLGAGKAMGIFFKAKDALDAVGAYSPIESAPAQPSRAAADGKHYWNCWTYNYDPSRDGYCIHAFCEEDRTGKSLCGVNMADGGWQSFPYDEPRPSCAKCYAIMKKRGALKPDPASEPWRYFLTVSKNSIYRTNGKTVEYRHKSDRFWEPSIGSPGGILEWAEHQGYQEITAEEAVENAGGAK